MSSLRVFSGENEYEGLGRGWGLGRDGCTEKVLRGVNHCSTWRGRDGGWREVKNGMMVSLMGCGGMLISLRWWCDRRELRRFELESCDGAWDEEAESLVGV